MSNNNKMVTLSILRNNRRSWLALSVLCLVVFGLYYYSEKGHGGCVPIPLLYCNRRVTALRTQQLEAESSLTNQTRDCETSEIAQIHHFELLLNEAHFFNHTNVEKLRIELKRKMGSYFKNYLAVDQQNTPKNHKFTFRYKNKSQAVKISEDIRKLLPNKVTYGNIPRCSVVGNSGVILNSRCGADIDKADAVFRCNAAPIRAFASDAGNKTNLTTFNPSIFRTRYKKMSQPQSVSKFLTDMKEYREFLWVPCFSYAAMKECIKVYKDYNVSENKFILGYPTHFQKVQGFWKSRGLKKRISSGLYLVTVALSHCREVHLFGFWPFTKVINRTIKDVPYHYFDKAKYNFSKAIHDMPSEFSELVKLHNLGIVKIHVKECDN